MNTTVSMTLIASGRGAFSPWAGIDAALASIARPTTAAQPRAPT